MIEIERPNIITVDLSEDGKHGTLSSNPLNAVMALPWELAQKGFFSSSLPGVAATSIKIEGVLHRDINRPRRERGCDRDRP